MELLNDNDFRDASEYLGVELVVIKAVAKIESSGKGFFSEGKAAILFEGHIFWKQLKKIGIDPTEISNDENRDILYPKWVKTFYKKGEAEYARLNKATKINKDAALKSASYGLFQIMGFNYNLCGFTSVQDFVDSMNKSEKKQLLAFCAFIKSNGLTKYLKTKDWEGFSLRYNGPGYKTNAYDTKLAQAYYSYLG